MSNHIEEIVKCANDFIYFSETYIKFLHPKKGLVPFQLHTYQKRLIKQYENEKYNLVIKFRQGGFTTLTIVYALWLAMFRLDQRILVIGKTDREAVHIGKIVKLIIENLPSWLKPRLDKNNEHEKYIADTNSNIWFYPPSAARSKSCTLIVIDEAAFIPNMDAHWKAIWPIVATGSKVIVISTTNGIGNWFSETVQDAEEGKNNFKLFQCSYKEHPDYDDPEKIDMMKRILGPKSWLQEVEGCFLTERDSTLTEETIKYVMGLTDGEIADRLVTIPVHEDEDKLLLHEARKRLLQNNSRLTED